MAHLHRPPPPAEPGRIYTSDCVRFMNERMAPGSVDLTVTSPPYDDLRSYDGHEFDFEGTARALHRVTKGGGRCGVGHGGPHQRWPLPDEL